MIDGDSMVITNELHGLTQLSKQILKGHHAYSLSHTIVHLMLLT